MGAKFTSLVTWEFDHYEDIHDWSPNAMLAARMRAFEALHSQRRRRLIGTVHAQDDADSSHTPSDTKQRHVVVGSDEVGSAASPRAGVLSLEDTGEESSECKRNGWSRATMTRKRHSLHITTQQSTNLYVQN